MTGRTGIISALLAVAALGLWLVCGRGVAKEAVYPVENGRSWFSRTIGVRLGGLFRGARVAAENQELRRQVARLSVLLSDTQRIAEENDRLRAMLSLDARDHGLTTNGWICADVVSRAGAGGVRNLIRVGRGSDHGVKAGAIIAVDAPAFELVGVDGYNQTAGAGNVAQAVEDEISIALDAVIRVPLD